MRLDLVHLESLGPIQSIETVGVNGLAARPVRKAVTYRASIVEIARRIVVLPAPFAPTRKLGSKAPLSEAGELLSFAHELSENLAAAPDKACVPIVASYPVGRSVHVHLRPKSREQFSQLAALDDSALNNSRDFRDFFAWFRDQEILRSLVTCC